MTNKILTKRIKAFTLTELLVVLVIVGILLLLALPNLMPLINKARSTEAKTQLAYAHTLQKTYFMEFSKYSEDLDQIDYIQGKLKTEGGSNNYLLEMVNVGANSFTIRATSVVDFDGDGTMNVWEIDQDKNLVETVKD